MEASSQALEPGSDQEYSLEDFNIMCGECLKSGRRNVVEEFLQLALAGKAIASDGDVRRIRLSPSKGTPSALGTAINVTRDFDSMFGISNDLPFRRSFAVFPVPSFRDTVTKDNHITRMIETVVRITDCDDANDRSD